MQESDHNTNRSAEIGRRFDLDWIRIAAFALLILYHVGMVFVPWYYHVKSQHIVPQLEPFMLALNPWRLSILFFVAGTATRFMAVKSLPGSLIESRSLRLLVPLVFGMLVIVPPQSYWEVVSRHLYSGDFLEFYVQHYFSFAAQFCKDDHCRVLPTWNHLWFVAYLWVYTVVIAVLIATFPRAFKSLDTALSRVSGIGLFVLPATALALYRVALFPNFPQTNSLIGDWYDHALYFSVFVIGFLIALNQTLWATIARRRWIWFGIAGAAFAIFLLMRVIGPTYALSLSIPPTAARVFYGLYQWSCILTALGFGRVWLDRDSPARRYLTEAIFPYYIVHQTIILGVAFTLRPLGLSALQEAAIIIAATVAGCIATYEIIRRIAWLRPLFGLKSKPA